MSAGLAASLAALRVAADDLAEAAGAFEGVSSLRAEVDLADGLVRVLASDVDGRDVLSVTREVAAT